MSLSLSMLSPALDLFEQQLQLFVESSEFYAHMALAFGESHDYQTLQPIFTGKRTNVLNLLEVVPSATLNGAYGTFSRDTNKIYLASEFIASATPSAIADVLLEEYGHYIDAQLNPIETLGDEGEIFADLVQGNASNPAAITEDDTATITLNGTPITIEQANANFLNTTHYFSFNDSPFKSIRDANQFSYFYLEDFEDGSLNTPGVAASSMSGTYLSTDSFPNRIENDSVDGDDGVIDGFGRSKHHLYDRGNGKIGGIRFTFSQNILGTFPTHVGIVWTDSYSNSSFNFDGSPLTFEAFNAQDISLGKIETMALEIGDSRFDGTTVDDRFFGVTYLEGISSLTISQTQIASANGFAIEVDHLQYGLESIDAAQYGASYTDLITGIGYNLDALTQHYQNSGRFEGRQPDLFDEYRYIASNSDLLNAFGANGAAATQHYITSGYYEGRSTTAFDSARYLLSNSDLLNAYGTNVLSASYHYVAYGSNENRDPNLFPSDPAGISPTASALSCLQPGFNWCFRI